MGINKHNTKRTFVAWLLLLLFMLPIVVKAVHVCQIHPNTEAGTSKADGHHSDNCAICHFAFLCFDKAEFITLGVIVATVVFTLTVFFQTSYVSKKLATASLRAPPYLF